MGFRFRRSARLGPLRFNFSKGGLSSISVGGRGDSFNNPVSRSGGARTTVELPGTGLSWSVEHTTDRPAAIPAGPAAGLPNIRRLRRGAAVGAGSGEPSDRRWLPLCANRWAVGADRNAGPSAASPPRRRPQGWPLGEAGSPDAARTGARRAGSPYPAAPTRTPQQAKDGSRKKEIPPHA
ncbi:MAG: DUF4236 domain-containing protein [Cyanobium sp. CZS 25K]|nr:DUF4236 domain-containing protein [Cyanobium sp. CZS25K]